MRSYYLLIILFMFIVFSCNDDSGNSGAVSNYGGIFGTVTDKETGDPVEGAYVCIYGKTALTDKKGKYSLSDIPFSIKVNVTVRANNYKEYESFLSLDREVLSFDIKLQPIESLNDQVLAVFNAFSKDIASLDPNRIPAIQSYFSKDYTAAKDDATLFGVFFGVIPPDYNGIPDTVANVDNTYKKLEFSFDDPVVNIDRDIASMQAIFTIIAESKPPDARSWEIVVNCRFDLQRQDSNWKITYCQLIPPFLKFVENGI